jgi:hypothetical protein
MISLPLPLHSLMHRQATTVVCLYESVGIRRLYPAIRRDSLCSITLAVITCCVTLLGLINRVNMSAQLNDAID